MEEIKPGDTVTINGTELEGVVESTCQNLHAEPQVLVRRHNREDNVITNWYYYSEVTLKPAEEKEENLGPTEPDEDAVDDD